MKEVRYISNNERPDWVKRLSEAINREIPDGFLFVFSAFPEPTLADDGKLTATVRSVTMSNAHSEAAIMAILGIGIGLAKREGIKIRFEKKGEG